MKPNMQRYKQLLVRLNQNEFAIARQLATQSDCNVQDLVRQLITTAARNAGIRIRPTVDPRQLRLRAAPEKA